jgi:hypothetical protein
MKKFLLTVITAVLLFAACQVLHNATPIPPDKAAFIGVWSSKSGFRIDIRSEGMANITQILENTNPDYEKLNIKVAPSVVTDIYVNFREDNTLEVIKPTLYAKEYHIDSYPSIDSLSTTMVLNGVTLTKE